MAVADAAAAVVVADAASAAAAPWLLFHFKGELLDKL